MAIASGIPVPQAFVLPAERGINAFAAGFTPRDAVVAATRGCIERLTRDELQGVVAHEFSHILNGDMRLNIRLIGILNGILVIALIGYYTLRGMSRTHSSGSSRKKGGGGAILLLAVALIIIGYIGVFFAKLIKAAVSRQRELLADAAAVQFTRYPPGLAGALRKIGGSVTGSFLAADEAEEASHLFFANGLRGSWVSLFATHPPLETRIRRLDPAWDGHFPHATPAFSADDADGAAVSRLGPQDAVSRLAAAARPRVALRPQGFMAQIGAPLPESLTQATRILASLPPELVDAARLPASAPAVVYGLLLHREPALREHQMELLGRRVGAAAVTGVRALLPCFAAVSPEARLPLAQVVLPALRQLAAEEQRRLLATMDALVNADAQVDLFEYMLRRMLTRHLAGGMPVAKTHPARGREVHALLPLVPACQKLLSVLAWAGGGDSTAATAAYGTGMRELLIPNLPPLLMSGECSLAEVDGALDALEHATLTVKKRVLTACVTCVLADGQATVAETELLRAVADSLDCPVSPLAATLPQAA